MPLLTSVRGPYLLSPGIRTQTLNTTDVALQQTQECSVLNLEERLNSIGSAVVEVASVGTLQSMVSVPLFPTPLLSGESISLVPRPGYEARRAWERGYGECTVKTLKRINVVLVINPTYGRCSS